MKTTARIRGTTKAASAAAKELRRSPTPAERVLREALKDRQVGGLRFRRQRAVGPFVIDSASPAARPAIEGDSGIHDEQIEQDRDRDRHVAGFG